VNCIDVNNSLPPSTPQKSLFIHQYFASNWHSFHHSSSTSSPDPHWFPARLYHVSWHLKLIDQESSIQPPLPNPPGLPSPPPFCSRECGASSIHTLKDLSSNLPSLCATDLNHPHPHPHPDLLRTPLANKHAHAHAHAHARKHRTQTSGTFLAMHACMPSRQRYKPRDRQAGSICWAMAMGMAMGRGLVMRAGMAGGRSNETA
jgi:hypothetical protein